MAQVAPLKSPLKLGVIAHRLMLGLRLIIFLKTTGAQYLLLFILFPWGGQVLHWRAQVLHFGRVPLKADNSYGHRWSHRQH